MGFMTPTDLEYIMHLLGLEKFAVSSVLKPWTKLFVAKKLTPYGKNDPPLPRDNVET